MITLTLPANKSHPPEHIAPQIDETLITDIAKGTKIALERLYQQTRTAVYGFALSILKNPSAAEDVMQETYLRVMSSVTHYRPLGKPMAWILTITRNLALGYLKKSDNLALSLEEDFSTVRDDPFDAERQLNRIVLEAALRQLTEQESQIVMLYNTAGFKHREIADFLGIPLATVLSKYRRALNKLQKTLSEDRRNGKA